MPGIKKTTPVQVYMCAMREKGSTKDTDTMTKDFRRIPEKERKEYEYRAARTNEYLSSHSDSYMSDTNVSSILSRPTHSSSVLASTKLRSATEGFTFSTVMGSTVLTQPHRKPLSSRTGPRTLRTNDGSELVSQATTSYRMSMPRTIRDGSRTRDFDDTQSFISHVTTIATKLIPQPKPEDLGFSREAFDDPLTTTFFKSEKETRLEKAQVKLVREIMNRAAENKTSPASIRWPLLSFECFYYLPDETPQALPAEVAVSTFSVDDGFRDMKEYHEFISPDGHPTKCFGLRGEIQIHTQQTNKLCLYQDSCSDYSRIYHRILEIGMEFSKLMDSVEISLVAQGVRSYIFFVFNVDVARTCLEFIASKANKTDHFKKHVKKGIFNYSRFVQAYYLMRNKVPNFSIDSLFIHPKMSFYDNIRCNYHNVDIEAESSKTCARSTMKKLGYTWWQCIKNLDNSIQGADYFHFPGDKLEASSAQSEDDMPKIITLAISDSEEEVEKSTPISKPILRTRRGLQRRRLAHQGV